MIDGVHRDSANGRAPPAMPLPPGLADDLVFVLDVPELSDGGAANRKHATDLAGRHADLRVFVFFGHQLRRTARTAHQLAAFTGPQLDVVQHGTERNVLDRQTVAGFDVRGRPRLDLVAYPQTERRKNVALFAVPID